VYERRCGTGSKFTRRYRIDRPVHFEIFSDILKALAREKQSRGRLRAKKIALIESANPKGEDLSAGW
jgi:putative endonuclease